MIELTLKKRLYGAAGNLDVDFTITIATGELVALYGPTGSGKSSVLRMIAGLMHPDGGRIVVEGNSWFDAEKKIDIPPQGRNIGMVFQDYSLFPNMTVRQNLEYALAKKQDNAIVDELLDVVEMKTLQDRRPLFLSGGQRQRVALARALVRRPGLLLLDEPLSALDEEMRSKLQSFILKFHAEMQLTTIMVTHDFREVVRMSKRMLVLENGRLKHDCSPEKLLG